MTIRIWNAFAPNNSSSCRLVARFADPRAAREAAVEVATFLIGHIRENRGQWNEGRVLTDFAAKYGLPATGILDWSSHLHVDSEPEIATEHGVLVVYHYYCQGFEHLVPMLQSKGATVDAEDYGMPTISVLARSRPGAHAELDHALASVFEHFDNLLVQTTMQLPTFKAPWSGDEERFQKGAYFRDAGTLGLFVSCEPHTLPRLEQWLADRGIERPSLRWCEWGDEALFRAIAKARCTACHGAVEYLDPRIYDIETPQFVCRACGGLYDRTALVP